MKVEPSFDIEQVATEVTTYVQTIIDDMDVEATLSNDYNRRSINLQLILTNQVVLSATMVKS